MVCQLYPLANISKVPTDWIPLIDGTYEGYIFYWATILSDNLSKHILVFRKSNIVSKNQIPPFYMYAYFYVCLYHELPMFYIVFPFHGMEMDCF